MRFGLALPQYDYSIVDERPLSWATVRDVAQRAEALGFDSAWVSDHLFLDIAKYGGSTQPEAAFEPIVTLAALARSLEHMRLGTLVFCEALRPASVLAKAIATLDCISGGRIDVGVGAGWYEPEYAAIGMDFPTPGVRLARMSEAVEILTGLLGESGGPLVFDGRFHHVDGARNLPTSVQRPRPPVFIGGKGDRLLRLVVERADGWNTCWVWTPEEYAARRDVLERECERVGRDPASVWCSLGLYALCGEDEADLARRFERLRGAHRRACWTTSASTSGGGVGWSGPSSRSASRSRSGTASASRPSSSGSVRSRSTWAIRTIWSCWPMPWA